MELDYIENIDGHDQNIVRLYNFNKEEAILFRELIVNTIIKKKQKLDLATVDFITPRNCNLIFGLFKTDEGILTKDNETFFCILTLEGFTNMARLLEPFCKKESKGYEYLYEIDNPTDLLFCPTASFDDEEDDFYNDLLN
ncbi:hypothetical protein [Polaribacter atrinae]|uniref:Uncharacterized protein n=1 Tax=Polaribacter atrinae TaxID=1333662 RepID=A0A176TDT3_9FLAO|nr:hypothetical protein [Polaribacter atrinae]OAD45566.1 hypothetical protein LPB303_07415 [Polaribacter atrinae]